MWNGPSLRLAESVLLRRADALPEFARYRDNGCDVAPACLECPLPRCRYEEPGGLRALLNLERDAEIARLCVAGVPVTEVASRIGASRRTVWRVLSDRGLTPSRPRRDFCRRGHPFVGVNLYVAPNGARVCRECRARRQRRTKEEAA